MLAEVDDRAGSGRGTLPDPPSSNPVLPEIDRRSGSSESVKQSIHEPISGEEVAVGSGSAASMGTSFDGDAAGISVGVDCSVGAGCSVGAATSVAVADGVGVSLTGGLDVAVAVAVAEAVGDGDGASAVPRMRVNGAVAKPP
jgi:hypothetical protein